MSVSRFSYLDGLRGFACIQVLMLHIVSGYYPELADAPPYISNIASLISHSPISFLYNGGAAVYLFFIISGFVLTQSYTKSQTNWRSAVESRLVRLWIPSAFFGFWSLALFVIFHHNHQPAGELVGSNWLRDLWNVKCTWNAWFQDIAVVPVFIGYKNSVLAQMSDFINSIVGSSGDALNSSVWTLSVEFQGSLITLFLCEVRKKAPILWLLGSIAIFSYAGAGYGLFVAGHILFLMKIDGVEFTGTWRVARFFPVALFISSAMLLPVNSFDGRYLVPAVIGIFVSVLLGDTLKSFFSTRLARRLGDLSFTIYLLHWAVVFGPGAWIVLKLAPVVGSEAGRAVGSVLGRVDKASEGDSPDAG